MAATTPDFAPDAAYRAFYAEREKRARWWAAGSSGALAVLAIVAFAFSGWDWFVFLVLVAAAAGNGVTTYFAFRARIKREYAAQLATSRAGRGGGKRRRRRR